MKGRYGFPTDNDLREIAGLDLDGINGFRATMANHGKMPLAPAHLRGVRWERWERGMEIASAFYGRLQSYGKTIRRLRAHDLRENGITSIIPNASDQRQVREAEFRSVVAGIRRET